MRDVTESQALQRQVLDIVNEEQRFVGQELHDSVLQDLTGLGLLAASLAEELPTGSPARQRAHKLAAELANVNRTVHQLAEGMLPQTALAGDLPSLLQMLAARTTQSHRLNCHVSCDEPVFLDDQTAHELYRVAQEAVTNSVRHARVRNINIGLAQSDETITLQILDDGIGIDDRT